MSLLGQSSDDFGKVLDTIDEVARIVGQDSGISIPQIAVIGDQSSGKSSLIESLVGNELPKASKLCTRCATRLQLRKSEDEGVWIEYEGQPKRQIYDARSIADEIKIATDNILADQIRTTTDNLLAQNDTDDTTPLIVDEEIVLTVQSPHHYNITLLDLPGFRADAMGLVVRSMVERIIKQVNTLIVVCMTADSDPEREQALQIAKQANPDCQRILIVLTKSDQADYGIEEKFETLQKQFPCGVIMVLNRTQQQLQDGFTLEEMRALETEFFQNPGAKDTKLKNLNKVDWRFKGRQALLEKLSQLQMSIIDISNLRSAIQQQLSTYSRQMKEAQDSLKALKDPLSFLHSLVSEITWRYTALATNSVGIFKGVDISKLPSNMGMIEENMRISNFIQEQSDLFAQKMADNIPNFFEEKGIEVIQSYQNHCQKAPGGCANNVQPFMNTFDALVLGDEEVLKFPLQEMIAEIFKRAKMIFEKMTVISVKSRGLQDNLIAEMNSITTDIFDMLKVEADDYVNQSIEMQSQTLGFGDYESKVKGTHLDSNYPLHETPQKQSDRGFLTFSRVFESCLDLKYAQSNFSEFEVDVVSCSIGQLMVLILKTFMLQSTITFSTEYTADPIKVMQDAKQAFQSCKEEASKQAGAPENTASPVLKIVAFYVSLRVPDETQIMNKLHELLPAMFDAEIKKLQENSQNNILFERDLSSRELFKIQCMLTMYLDVAVKWFKHTIPMYLRHKVVDQANNRLHDELFQRLKNDPYTDVDSEEAQYVYTPAPKPRTTNELIMLLGNKNFKELGKLQNNYESVREARRLLEDIPKLDSYAN